MWFNVRPTHTAFWSQILSDSAAGTAKKGHPRGLYYLFGTEAMERFSYYGMRAILVLYLVAATTDGGVGLTRENALSIYATYTGLVYLTPLIGGFLADKYLGARKAIFIGGLVMMFGEMLMMFPNTLYYGLAFLILGNGFFKPNISTIVGQLYEDNDPRRDGAFTIFYMGINVGAFFSPLVCGTLGERLGWEYGFAGAAIGMAVGIVIFLMGQKSFGKAGFPPSRKDLDENSRLLVRDWLDIGWITIAVCAVASACVLLLDPFTAVWSQIPEVVKGVLGVIILVGAITGLFGMAYKGGMKENKAKAVSDAKAVAAILVISLFVIFFWLGFEQAGGTMTLFAEEQTDRHIFGWEMPASYFQSVNPIFIVILAPIFSLMWTKIDSNPRTRLSVVYKMCIALCLLGLGFLLLYAGQSVVQQDNSGAYIVKASPFFLVGVYFLHTCGELCLSPIGLSLVTKLSPARMVSLMMGVWFLSSAGANYMAGNLEAFLETFKINIFAFLIISSFAAAVLLFAISPLLRSWMNDKPGAIADKTDDDKKETV